MSNEGVTVTMTIQDGIKTLQIPFDVPPGIDPRMAVAVVQETLNELHELAPLHPIPQKVQVAMGLFGDAIPIAKIKGMLLEAPQGAEWGIQIVEPPRVLASPTYRRGESPFIKARARLSECENINEVISTLTCYALLSSRVARGLGALHGYMPRIVPPPPRQDVGPKPNGVHERHLKLVASEPGDGEDGA